ncbi:hypothetical protein ROSINTL182_08414 [Roseburia intestinalis L1-82]|uniref:Uncharacterized protein n=1 Tax=Roseburia intestinalis L1-82 TaxID=536231 RepID=C7GER2_9FIRM|nr:hypothetical protein ROSINTL182_08414 [Roseburia intestinalis L1-82]
MHLKWAVIVTAHTVCVNSNTFFVFYIVQNRNIIAILKKS